MPRTTSLTVALLVAVGCGGAGTAGGGGVCRPGESAPCVCDDGREGTRPCGGVCACEPVVALAADPPVVAFGVLPPGVAAERTVRLVDEGETEVALRRVAIEPAGPDFALAEPGVDRVPVNGSVALSLRFRSDVSGGHAATLVVESDAGTLRVPLVATVTGPALSCTPAELGLAAAVADRETAEGAVLCTSVGIPGADGDATVRLRTVSIEGPRTFTAHVRDGMAEAGYPPGASFVIDVTHRPTGEGPESATLRIDAGAVTAAVAITGVGVGEQPCDLEIPGEVRFGIVDPGETSTREVRLANRRPDVGCRISGVRLAPGTDAAYALAPIDEAWVPAGGSFTFPIRFRPAGYQDLFEGAILLDVADPAAPHRSIALSASRPAPRVELVPGLVDFGVVAPGCRTREREVQLVNWGAERVRVMDVQIENGGQYEEFWVRQEPMSGTELPPGGALLFKLAYRAADLGLDHGRVLVQIEGLEEPVAADLQGRGEPNQFQTDRFSQGARFKVDVLAVIDNGTGMAEESGKAVAALGPLGDIPTWVDAHLAVTTTSLVAQPGAGCPGGADGGEDGRLFPVDGTRPRIVDASTPNARAVWEANLAVGACSAAPAQGLEAALRALTAPLSTSADDTRYPAANDGNLGFLRLDASLTILFVTDRPDASPGSDDAYLQAFAALKAGRGGEFGLSAITGPTKNGCTGADGSSAAPGDRLVGLVGRSSYGVHASLCGKAFHEFGDWGIPPPFGFKTCFYLGNQPEDGDHDGVVDEEDELRVSVDGVVVPSADAEGTRYWHYNPEQNAVCFFPTHAPPPGAEIVVRYRVACITD